MKSISLYTEKNTPVHRMEPLTKMLYVLTAILAPVFAGARPAYLVTLGASLALLLAGRVLRKALPLVGVSLVLLVTVVLIQGLFRAGNATPALALGPVVFYREGLHHAFGTVLNVWNIVLGFSVLILTTRPSDIVEELVRCGLSPRLGYVVGSVFQIVPQMSESMETISDAQRSRGMETEGRLIQRARAFFPLISPVVMNALVTTRERAIALEVRGFSATGKRTFYAPVVRRRADRILRPVLLLILGGALAWRVLTWLI